MASTRAVPAVAQRAPAEPRGRHLRPWRALLAGAAWVGTIFSIFLHLIDDSGQQITGLPGVLDILGTVSGLIAMNSLLFMHSDRSEPSDGAGCWRRSPRSGH